MTKSQVIERTHSLRARVSVQLLEPVEPCLDMSLSEDEPRRYMPVRVELQYVSSTTGRRRCYARAWGDALVSDLFEWSYWTDFQWSNHERWPTWLKELAKEHQPEFTMP